MLQSEIVNLTHANKVAEQRAADANRAKEQYKEQVRKLAKQLAMTQRAKMELEARTQKALHLQQASNAAAAQMDQLKYGFAHFRV